jgi:hypothetical protein
VKSVKRLLRTNIAVNWSLDTDAVMRGLLQLRNTPDPDTKLSPSLILLGRKLKETFCQYLHEPQYMTQQVQSERSGRPCGKVKRMH